ncbi:hypothetical protein B0T18DRAFT_214828 [Schizothecium vesticola]|uniref:Uncharacterized protein n=1 Tax=Schizothecium vesticola TaxID=314040 RepID=A0AA40EK08_9PEZI|nr:hypothetical protein B0T18DRAFT_214828 [Schizothecium vesticola]
MVVSRMLDGGRARGKQGEGRDDRETRGREVNQDSMRLCSLCSSSPRDVPKHGRDENRNRLKRARQTESPSGGLERAEEADLPHGISCLGLLANQTERGGGKRKTGFRPKGTQRLGVAPPDSGWRRGRKCRMKRKRVNAGWILCTRQRGKHMAHRRGLVGGIGAPEAIVKRAPSPIRPGQIAGLAASRGSVVVTPDRGRRLERCSAD